MGPVRNVLTMTSYLVLPEGVVLRQLETPVVYDCRTDTLYEIDEEAFRFLHECAEKGVSQGEPRDTEFVGYCLEEGLLQEQAEQPPKRRVDIRKAPLPSLRYLELQITNRCNLRCRHCYLGPARPVDLSLAQVREALEQFVRIQGLRLLVSGGEPLLHPMFREVNGLLRGVGVRVVLLSNGTLIDEHVARNLTAQEVQVSLDGMRDGHEILRGTGSFDRVMAAIRYLIEAGKTVSVATMVHTGNVGEFDEMAALLPELGVSEWAVDAPCDLGALWENRELMLPPEEAGRFLSYGFGGSLHEGGEGALCGSHLMTITPEGLGCKCGYYSDRPLGRLEEGLDLLWSRLPKPGIDSLSCACPHLETCRGGCRFRAERAGDPCGPDPVKCGQFGVARG